MKTKYTFIDLFSGAGGLAEGFINGGFEPVCHIEMNADACATLKTRLSYHWLKKFNRLGVYHQYLNGEITRDSLYNSVPKEVLDSVINETITYETLPELFDQIDKKISDKNQVGVDVIIGGPPCQAYSLAGRSSKRNNPLKEDCRNYLYELYIEFLKRYKPKVFVFENVVGLLSADNGSYLNDFLKKVSKIHYSVEYRTLNAKDYGVLQNRRRVIVVGVNQQLIKGDLFPDTVDSSKYIVSDLFSDLPALDDNSLPHEYLNEPTEYLSKFKLRTNDDVLTLHYRRPLNKRDSEIYKTAIQLWNDSGVRLNYSKLPKKLKNHKNEKVFLDRFKVVAPNLHESQTMLAHIAKDGHYFIHPSLAQARSISIREAARIQSFPDSYYFEGSRSAAFVQIGNAVPPLMSLQIAKKINKYLMQRER